ncbi:uncharacterized protein [Elaeis guineensis]|uniref:Uncharacterized protein LOC105043385 n=1 Tax=Elaeis guineensis var. tenera TaxID=51953 RepID=A0A6I9R896_ELAGV|nr:uncharacterized protein LOC105043385 [Elaeis guineensis]
MTGQKPLMLKEYLELDSDLESCSGSGCALRRGDSTTMRFLLESELRCDKGRLVRARSKGTLTRLSAVINALRLLPFGASSSGCRSSHERFLARSLSKRLKGRFWKKRGKEEENDSRVRVKDIVRLRPFEEGEEKKSFEFASPVVSSRSSRWETETDTSGSEFLLLSIGSSDCLGEIDAAGDGDVTSNDKNCSPPRQSPTGKMFVGGDSVSVETATGHREPESERMACPGCQSVETEQLSPVSVMDFPYEDEEEPSSPSLSFQQSLANIERTKLQLLQKIRRFESLAELEPMDLVDRLSSFDDQLESSDHVASDDGKDAHRDTVETRAWDLLWDLEARAQLGPLGCIEKLLVDFFVERLSSSDSADQDRPSRCRKHVGITSGACEPEEILKAAGKWIDGASSRKVEEFPGEAEIKEMEVNGRWRCFDEEEEEVAVDLVDVILGSLVRELVLD